MVLNDIGMTEDSSDIQKRNTFRQNECAFLCPRRNSSTELGVLGISNLKLVLRLDKSFWKLNVTFAEGFWQLYSLLDLRT